MKVYDVVITGKTPLLMHADNIEWADMLNAWKDDPANKKASKAGEDRTPAWRWIGCLYADDKYVAIPSDNLMRCLMEGGAMVPVPGGKSGKTFKAQTQSGLMIGEAYWALEPKIERRYIDALMEEDDFSNHKKRVSELGFSLFVKRARIGQTKHVRVRPRFDTWSATGSIVVIDEQITGQVLRDVLSYAGQYKGLGDWRPGGRTPGAFGMFSAEVSERI